MSAYLAPEVPARVDVIVDVFRLPLLRAHRDDRVRIWLTLTWTSHLNMYIIFMNRINVKNWLNWM